MQGIAHKHTCLAWHTKLSTHIQLLSPTYKSAHTYSRLIWHEHIIVADHSCLAWRAGDRAQLVAVHCAHYTHLHWLACKTLHTSSCLYCKTLNKPLQDIAQFYWLACKTLHAAIACHARHCTAHKPLPVMQNIAHKPLVSIQDIAHKPLASKIDIAY